MTDRMATCPHCGSDRTEIISLFGSQLLTLQYYCLHCKTPFECVRDDRALRAAREFTRRETDRA